jgi:Phosphotransferase enzyme family
MTRGLVRIGSTVRRPLHDRSAYVQAVLQHLEAVGFDGAPRFLGVDEQGREILTYIEGDVLDGTPALISDGRLRTAARLIREFHSATAGTALADGGEVVCHGDLGHHNTVFRGERAVGLVDWDDGVAPGFRLVDLAHAVWCFAGVGEGGLPISYQAHAVGVMCEVYGWTNPGLLVDEIADRLRRARDEHARNGRSGAVAEFGRMIASMNTIEPELRLRFT